MANLTFQPTVMVGDPNNGWNQLAALLGAGLGRIYDRNAQDREAKKADKIIADMQNQQELNRIEAMRQAAPTQTVGEQIMSDRLNSQMQGMDGNFTFNIPSVAEQFAARNPVQDALNRSNKAGMDAIVNEMAMQKNMTPEQRALANWNPSYTEANVRSALEKADVRNSIIDKKMEAVKEDVAARARAALVPQIQSSLYGTFVEQDDGKGGKKIVYQQPSPTDYSKAMGAIFELNKYDPAAAKVLMSGVVTPRDMYSQQNREKLAQASMDNQQKLAQENFLRRLAYLQMKQYISQNGNNNKTVKNNNISLSDYKQALSLRDQLKQKYVENGNKLDADDINTFNTVCYIIEAFEGTGGQQQGQQQAQQQPQAPSGGVYQGGGVAGEGLNALAPKEAPKKETEEERKARLNAILFPDEYSQGNTTLDSWLKIGDIIKRVVKGEPLVNAAHPQQ